MSGIPYRLAVLATVLAALASAAGIAMTGLYQDAPNWVAAGTGDGPRHAVARRAAHHRWTVGVPSRVRGRPRGRPRRAAVPRLQLRNLRVRGGDERSDARPHRDPRAGPVEPGARRAGSGHGMRPAQRPSGRPCVGSAPRRDGRAVRPPVDRPDHHGQRDRRPAARPRDGRSIHEPRCMRSTLPSSCPSASSRASASCVGRPPGPSPSRC